MSWTLLDVLHMHNVTWHTLISNQFHRNVLFIEIKVHQNKADLPIVHWIHGDL